jgi:Polysaccharide deacetylase
VIDRGLPILTYHSIDESASVISTARSTFRSTLVSLREAGFRAIDLGHWIKQGRPAVERSFAITFDDGYRNVLGAAELLAAFDWTATLFLVTDHIGRDNAWPGQPLSVPRLPMLSWPEIHAAKSLGMKIGAHTRTHPRLDRLNESFIADEIRICRDSIEQGTGERCDLFAYPYGTYSKRARNIAETYFEASFGTILRRCTQSSPLHNLPRIDSYYLRSPGLVDRWIIKTSSIYMGAIRSLRALKRWSADTPAIFT